MIVVDTGVLYALADRSDTHHRACVNWLRQLDTPAVVPGPVIAGSRRDRAVGKPLTRSCAVN